MTHHKLLIVIKIAENGEVSLPEILPDITSRKTATADNAVSLIWVMSDGTLGMRFQAIALGKALQNIDVLRSKLDDIIIKPPWLLRHMPKLAKILPLAWLRAMIEPSLPVKLDLFLPPTIVITCGRRTAGLSIAMQRLGKVDTNSANCVKRIHTIHIQDPRLSSKNFDVLIVPQHDRVRGPNVVTSMASLNRLNNANIKNAAIELDSKWTKLPAPRVAVLLGGNNRRYKISMAMINKMAAQLRKFATSTGTSLALIPSQRAPTELLDNLTKSLTLVPHALANPKDKNPYPGILGIVEATIVTSDSVNLTSEAAITGKPVFIAKWQDETGRIGSFHAAMMKAGHTMPLDNSALDAKFIPLDEMPKIIKKVVNLLPHCSSGN